MKQLLALLLLTFSYTCNAQFKVSDASPKIDTASLTTSCDCNAAAIIHMKEVISLLEEIKRIQKKGSSTTSLKDEVNKRDVKYYEISTYCMSIYKKEGSMSNCSNYAEGEELDKKIRTLRKELHLE